MITHNLIQGTPEWHAFRAAHFPASEAPAMLGVSPYKTRNQLLQEKATGITAEVDAATQRRFDDGHRFEALAPTPPRPS
jgi:predicted phage-related endonuclease